MNVTSLQYNQQKQFQKILVLATPKTDLYNRIHTSLPVLANKLLTRYLDVKNTEIHYICGDELQSSSKHNQTNAENRL